jgi:hypothetical protein
VLLPLYVYLLCLQGHNSFSLNSKYGVQAELSEDEWKSVLRLSTAWEFPAVRQVAITHLSKIQQLDPVEKLIIAVRFHVDAWLVDTLNQLARRDAPLSINDTERLIPVVGLEYVTKIAQVRENETVIDTNPTPSSNQCYCNRCGCYHPSGGYAIQRKPRSERDYSSIIRSVFDLAK